MKSNIILFILLTALIYGCDQSGEPDPVPGFSIPNIQVNNDDSEYQPNETTISINPVNPDNIIAGANMKYYYYSFDGGQTWEQNELVTPLGVYGDPCVAFDNIGNAYYSHLARVEGEFIGDRMVVQKSTDGGITWNEGVGFSQNGAQHDREWMCTDRSDSDYSNSVYVTWTQYDEYLNPDPDKFSYILCSASRDHGTSYSDPVIVSDKTGDCMDDDTSLQGAKCTTGSDGELFVCWSGLEGILFDRSLDGGATFGEDVLVTKQAGGWAQDNVPGVSRNDGCPSMVCDLGNSETRGTLYIVWSDLRNGEDNTDIFLKKSNDGGETWGMTVQVNDDNSGRHQFFPNVAIDPATGVLYVVFYDRRDTQGNATHVYLARSADGGKSFTNERVSRSSFTPPDVFIGDYIDIAALKGKVYPIWTRATTESRSIIVALYDDNGAI